MGKLVYLFSDLGNTDTSIGEMHAVMKGIDNPISIVDMTHNINSFQQGQAAYFLETRLGNVPTPFASVVVVDPGVGSERKGLIIKTKEKGFLIGPDNGCLIPAALKYGIEGIRAIEDPKFFNPNYQGVLLDENGKREKKSDIFHGRDVFAPAAAYLFNDSEGGNFDHVGTELTLDEVIRAPYEAATVSNKTTTGVVPFIDEFGNVFTNIPLKDFFAKGEPSYVELTLRGKDFHVPFKRSFAAVEEGRDVALDDSYGYLHLSKNMGNFAKAYKIKVGDIVEVRPEAFSS